MANFHHKLRILTEEVKCPYLWKHGMVKIQSLINRTQFDQFIYEGRIYYQNSVRIIILIMRLITSSSFTCFQTEENDCSPFEDDREGTEMLKLEYLAIREEFQQMIAKFMEKEKEWKTFSRLLKVKYILLKIKSGQNEDEVFSIMPVWINHSTEETVRHILM